MIAQIPMNAEKNTNLPTSEQLRQAVELFLREAHPSGSVSAERFRPPETFKPAQWLMSDLTERDPQDASLASVRSFVFRIGNDHYPHMKLRLSRPPNDLSFLFSVDCHDAFLHAPAGSGDEDALAELKVHNAKIADAICKAWDADDLPTERAYLRKKIEQARQRAAGDPGQ